MAVTKIDKHTVSLSGEDLRLYLKQRFPKMTQQEVNDFVKRFRSDK